MVAKIIVTFERWLGTVGPVHGRWLRTCRYANTFSEPRPNVPLCLWVTMPGRRMSSWGGFGVVFARTWVPPWRARGSWQTQSRKIQPTSRRIQPKSRKIQPTSREIPPKSPDLAASRHNNNKPVQTRAISCEASTVPPHRRRAARARNCMEMLETCHITAQQTRANPCNFVRSLPGAPARPWARTELHGFARNLPHHGTTNPCKPVQFRAKPPRCPRLPKEPHGRARNCTGLHETDWLQIKPNRVFVFCAEVFHAVAFICLVMRVAQAEAVSGQQSEK